VASILCPSVRVARRAQRDNEIDFQQRTGRHKCNDGLILGRLSEHPCRGPHVLRRRLVVVSCVRVHKEVRQFDLGGHTECEWAPLPPSPLFPQM
jgi:hypothetical protein